LEQTSGSFPAAARAGALMRELRGARLHADGGRLRADRADRACRHQQIEYGADRERADQTDRHVALRVLGFLGGGRDRVEADIGEEDRGRRADDAHAARSRRAEPAIGCERRKMLALDRGEGEHDEHGERRHLDRHQRGVEIGALLGADHQQRGHRQRHDDGGHVDDAVAEIRDRE
jgi:hypothetical protein